MSRLSDRQVKAMRPKEKDYVVSDGGGLQLRVRTNGSRLWNFNYYHPVTKKRINLGLGPYPEVSLAEARKQAMEARELVAQGVDPKQSRDQGQETLRETHEQTLKAVTERWFEMKREQITPDYADDVWRSFVLHVFPSLGNIPVKDISAPVVIDALKPLEAKGTLETLKRVTQRLNEVMTFAANAGLVFSNPLAGIRAVFRKPQAENMPALPPEQLPELMRALATASVKLPTRLLIEWQLHTMTRPGEAAATAWGEIDLEKKLWTIPAERMKKRRDHVIPLTKQAVAILEAIRPYSGHREFVFPGDRNPQKAMNNQTANMALKRMGFEGILVSHGLRAIASTAMHDHGWDVDLIDVALSHVDPNEVRGAYNRAQYIERRRPMMEWWSDKLSDAKKQAVD